MFYRLTADLLLVAHLLFIVLVLVGGLLVLRWPRFAWAHLPIVVWGFLVELMGWVCPLTPLEQSLRRAAGDGAYRGSFIEHYLVPLIYPEGMTHSTRMLFAAIVATFNILIYTGLYLRHRHRLWRR